MSTRTSRSDTVQARSGPGPGWDVVEKAPAPEAGFTITFRPDGTILVDFLTRDSETVLKAAGRVETGSRWCG